MCRFTMSLRPVLRRSASLSRRLLAEGAHVSKGNNSKLFLGKTFEEKKVDAKASFLDTYAISLAWLLVQGTCTAAKPVPMMYYLAPACIALV